MYLLVREKQEQQFLCSLQLRIATRSGCFSPITLALLLRPENIIVLDTDSQVVVFNQWPFTMYQMTGHNISAKKSRIAACGHILVRFFESYMFSFCFSGYVYQLLFVVLCC